MSIKPCDRGQVACADRVVIPFLQKLDTIADSEAPPGRLVHGDAFDRRWIVSLVSLVLMDSQQVPFGIDGNDLGVRLRPDAQSLAALAIPDYVAGLVRNCAFTICAGDILPRK